MLLFLLCFRGNILSHPFFPVRLPVRMPARKQTPAAVPFQTLTRSAHASANATANGIRPGPEKIRALRDYAIKDIKSLRGFLGLASFFRRSVKDFGSIAEPLHALLKKKAPWVWGSAQETAKISLVNKLTSAPFLAHFDDTLDITVQTDASHCGLGAILP